MANAVQNRYASLIRCLGLKGSPGPFVLQDELVPVVVVCQGYGQETFFVSDARTNAVGNTNSAALSAGMYQVSWCLTRKTLIAAAEEQLIQILNPNGSVRATLASLWTVSVGDSALAGSFLINIRDGELLSVTADASGGATNQAAARMVVQPL